MSGRRGGDLAWTLTPPREGAYRSLARSTRASPTFVWSSCWRRMCAIPSPAAFHTVSQSLRRRHESGSFNRAENLPPVPNSVTRSVSLGRQRRTLRRWPLPKHRPGRYVYLSGAVSAVSGAEVAVEFALPAFDLVPYPIKLRCIGRVSRVETCYQLSGFAVAGRFANETLEGTCH